MLIKTLFILLVIIVFSIIIIFVVYYTFHKLLDKKYQKIYFLNHKLFNRGHFFDWESNDCPRGCVGKKCVYGSSCFNCHDDDPQCCCYDQQCGNC